ncbi:MAG: sensor histidine kinase, partial [bacterium]
HLLDGNSSSDLASLSGSVASVLADLTSGLETLEVGIYYNGDLQKELGGKRARENSPSGLPGSLPEWVEDGFLDLVVDGSDVAFLSASVVGDFLVVGRLQFDQHVIDYLKRRTSIEIQLARFTPGDAEYEVENREFREGQSFLSIVWVHFYTPTVWRSGASESRVIFISIPLSSLLYYFYNRFAEPGPFILLILIASVFVVTILVSLVIGAALARSITRSIHNMYRGAQSIQKGDFNFRIPCGSSDQLDAMAESFNRMSASIVGLMKEVSDKERLEKEIEIAK